MSDSRALLYADIHRRQFIADESITLYSAARIFDILAAYVSIASVIDVGCGLGNWLRVAAMRGIVDIRGIEGPWLDPALLRIDPTCVELRDLERELDLGRRFDLVISIEVAEHLPERAADGFIRSLTRHGPLVLFSAAIPFQGGCHHANEQFPPYWAALFARHGFRALDVVRPRIWDDTGIHRWLRQNTLLFAHDEALAANERLRAAQGTAPLAVVHPDYWVGQAQSVAQWEQERDKITAFARQVAQERDKVTALLRQGGLFEAIIDEKGDLVVNRVGDAEA